MNQRLPPHNIEAEEATLGSLLIDPNALSFVLSFLKSNDFYQQSHGWIYEAMVALHEQQKDIDFVTLLDELQNQGRLEEVGGAGYIVQLTNTVPSAMHIESYARIIKETSHRRALLTHASNLAQIAHEGGDNLTEKSMKIGGELIGQSYSLNGKGTGAAVELLKDQIQEWANDPLEPGEVRGMTSGFRSIDTMLGGLVPSLMICAATTSIGKTAFACQLAVNMAKAGHSAIYFTKEMSTQEVLTRMACAESKINWLQIQAGTLTEAKLDVLMDTIDFISSLPLVINDECNNVVDIQATINGRNTGKKEGLIVVDYLGLYVPREVDHRSLKLGCAAQALLALSRQEQCTVLALHQIGRKVADRQDKRPQLSDLQWSGMLEQDADIVSFLHREQLNTQLANGAANPEGRQMEFIVRKNRKTGRLGKAMLYFGEYAELRDMQKGQGQVAPPMEEAAELGLIPW